MKLILFTLLILSPDGEHIAYLYIDEGQSKIAIMNLKKTKEIYSYYAGLNRELKEIGSE